jgi:hypothetical protein
LSAQNVFAALEIHDGPSFLFRSNLDLAAGLFQTPIMHYSVVFLPILLFLGLANAAPTPGEDGHDNHWWDGQKCLTDQEASDIATAFEGFYGVFNLAQAESLIADDFQSISDSNGNFYPNFVVRYSSLNLQSHIHLLYAIFTPLQ